MDVGPALTSLKRVGPPCATSRKTGGYLIPCSSGTYARNSGLRWTRTVLAKSGRSTRTNDSVSRREHQRINGDGGRPCPARAHHRPGGGRAGDSGELARVGRP